MSYYNFKKRIEYSVLFLVLFFVAYSCANLKQNGFEDSFYLMKVSPKDKIALFGHQSPDLDSYGSAIAYADLLRKKGYQAQAYSLGPANLETEYVLNFLKEKPLSVLRKAPAMSKLILLDHNEKKQSVPGLDSKDIIEIVDHHRVDLKTPDTISMRVEKIGSTATIIFKKYLEQKVKVSYKSAVFLLAAVLSDTRILSSPTTTEQDILACKKLSSLANLDYKKFGKEVLLAGTRTDHLTAEDLYRSDLKKYNFLNQKSSIGIISTISIEKTLERREELVSFMHKYLKENKLDFSVLLITDLIKNDSYGIVIGDKSLFDKAFKNKKKGGDYYLDSVVSRKRQVIPKLEAALN